MANGLTTNFSLAYAGNNVAITEAVVNQTTVVTGNGQNGRKDYSAPTADTAIPLGSVTAPSSSPCCQSSRPGPRR